MAGCNSAFRSYEGHEADKDRCHVSPIDPAGVVREEAAPAAGVSGICTFDEFVKEVSLKTHWVS